MSKEHKINGLTYRKAAKEVKTGSVKVKCLLLYYAICANDDGTFYKSYLDTFLDTGIPERSVRRINESLIKCGILSKTEPKYGSGDATDYQLLLKGMQQNIETFKDTRDKEAAAIRMKQKERLQKWREGRALQTSATGT